MPLWSGLLARPNRPQQIARPSLTLFFLLSGAFLLTLVPHAVELPLWLTLSIIASMLLRSVIEFYRLPLPSATFCGIIALLLLGAVLLQYNTVMGRDAGMALTAGLVAIKFYELRGPRDVALIIFCCFFIVMSALLYSQVVELFIYCLIMMWVLTALLMRVHTGDVARDRLLLMLQHSGLVFLQALPLTLILFFLFPRYTGHLGLTLDEASIGLSPVLTPGSIAQLSQSDADAMYVQFTPGSIIPLTGSMYWRAMVLSKYERGAWTAGDIADAGLPLKPLAKAENSEVQQTITILAHHQKWLFALDVPVSIPYNPSESSNWARASYGHVVQLNYSSGKLDHMTRYVVMSSDAVVTENMNAKVQQASTDLPTEEHDQISPDVKALAAKLHEGLSDGQEEEYINAVIHYFRHGGFSYSQTPGDEGGPGWLPVFMFKTKTGFCEHYASAFAVLLRLEQIPTRVVIGYWGADYNPYTDQYTVSQSNAHAWDEVWIWDKDQPPEGRRGHWKRFDPTSLITTIEPTRQADNSGDPGDTSIVQVTPHQMSLAEQYFPTWAKESLREVKLRREEVETNWDNLVLAYDTSAQDRLAQALGFGRGSYFQMFAVCFAAGAICLFFFRQWITRKPVVTPIESLYAAFCRFMARRGHPRAAWEGPLAYTERVAEAFPGAKPAIHRVGSIVAQARYSSAPLDPAAPDKLQSLLTLITASSAAASSRERN